MYYERRARTRVPLWNFQGNRDAINHDPIHYPQHRQQPKPWHVRHVGIYLGKKASAICIWITVISAARSRLGNVIAFAVELSYPMLGSVWRAICNAKQTHELEGRYFLSLQHYPDLTENVGRECLAIVHHSQSGRFYGFPSKLIYDGEIFMWGCGTVVELEGWLWVIVSVVHNLLLLLDLSPFVQMSAGTTNALPFLQSVVVRGWQRPSPAGASVWHDS